MPPKPKTTAMEHDVKAKDWGKRLWGVILDEKKYNDFHETFFKEFNSLRDEAQDFLSSKVTMMSHVAPIYDHIASQGYTAHIHFKPLFDAVANFCEGRPVAAWKGPPDRFSRSSSPLPASPQPQSPQAGPSKKKTHVAISDERDYSEKESGNPPEGELVKPPKATTDMAKSNNAEGLDEPSTDGMERCPTKCTKCATRNHGCHVNPKPMKKTSASAACFECNHWRLKCSLATRTPAAKKGEDAAKKGEDEEEGTLKEPPPKRQVRKKPIQVPAGQPGQYTGKPVLIFLTSLIYFN
jgi:hypothetical protein